MTQTVHHSIDYAQARGGTPLEPQLATSPEILIRQAIEDHLEVVRKLIEQQELIESIAGRITKAILAGVKCCGVEMAGVRLTASISRRNLLADFVANGGASHPWHSQRIAPY